MEKSFFNQLSEADLRGWDWCRPRADKNEITVTKLLKRFKKLSTKSFCLTNGSQVDLFSFISVIVSNIPAPENHRLSVFAVKLDEDTTGIRIETSYPIYLHLDVLKFMISKLVYTNNEINIKNPTNDPKTLPLMRINTNKEDIVICYDMSINCVSMLSAVQSNKSNFLIEFAINESIASNLFNIILGTISSCFWHPKLDVYIQLFQEKLIIRRLLSNKEDFNVAMRDKSVEIASKFFGCTDPLLLTTNYAVQELNLSCFVQCLFMKTQNKCGTLRLMIFQNGVKFPSSDPFVVEIINLLKLPIQLIPDIDAFDMYGFKCNMVNQKQRDILIIINTTRVDIVSPIMQCIQSVFNKLDEADPLWFTKTKIRNYLDNSLKIIQMLQESAVNVLGIEESVPYVWNGCANALQQRAEKNV